MEPDEFIPKIDPRIKPGLHKQLMERVYAPTDHRLKTLLEEIVKANAQALGLHADHPHFIYKGVYYLVGPYDYEASLDVMRKMRQPLAKTLHADMDAYIRDSTEVKNEKPFVAGCLTAVLNASNVPADWLRLLPENLHDPVLPIAAHYQHLTPRLSDEKVEDFNSRYAALFNVMRCRMVLNMIL